MTRKSPKVSVEDLDRATSILGAQMRLRLIPGTEWAWDRMRRIMMYPRARIMAMEANVVWEYLFRTIQHALSSHGTFAEYDVAVDAVCAAETAADGKRLMHPQWVLQLVMAAERERVERIARNHARNLGNSYLPVRGSGHRTEEWTADKTAMHAVVPTPGGYWNRATIAFGGIASGALAPEELPEDIRWDNGLCTRIKALPEFATYDELLTGVEALVPELVKAWIESLVPPKAGESEGDPTENPDDAEGSGAEDSADDSSETPTETPDDSESDDTKPEPERADEDEAADDAKPHDPTDADESDDTATDASGSEENDDAGETLTLADLLDLLGEDALETISAALEDLGEKIKGIDYFDGELTDGSPASDHEKPTEEWERSGCRSAVNDRRDDGPAWASVSRSNTKLIESLRRVLLDHLQQNELGEIEYGTKSGRLNLREASRPAAMQSATPFKRRSEPEEYSYAVHIVLDRSGSMGCTTEGDSFPEAFGPGPLQRWHLAARMGVALAEALDRLDSAHLELGVITYDHTVDLVKRLGDPLSSSVKQKIMNTVRANGDNDDAGALRCALNDLRGSSAERKIIIHLTDGEFCSSLAEMRSVVNDIHRENVDLVILTLDIPATNARQYVPAHYADEVNDHTLARVLGKHLQRMLAA